MILMNHAMMGAAGYVAAGGLITDGLVSRWLLDEAGGTTAFDSQGLHDGALSGGVSLNGSNASFNAVDGMISFGVDPAGIPTGAAGQKMTITANIYPASLPANAVIMSSYEPPGTGNWMLRLEDQAGLGSGGHVWFRTYGGNNGGSATSLASIGNWLHVAATWDAGSSISVYGNGELDKTTSVADLSSSTNATLTLGYSAGGVVQGFHGRMKDVRIYDRILSASEIASIANGEG